MNAQQLRAGTRQVTDFMKDQPPIEEGFPPSSCSPDFDPASLHLRYSNLRIPNATDPFCKYRYIVRDKIGHDAGDIGFGNGGMLVFVDNFPSQKKYYRQEIPIRTWAEFESDIARAGLPLILANDKGQP